MADGARRGVGTKEEEALAPPGREVGPRSGGEEAEGGWWPRRLPLAVWLGWCRRWGLRCNPLWILAPPVAMEILTKW